MATKRPDNPVSGSPSLAVLKEIAATLKMIERNTSGLGRVLESIDSKLDRP